MLYKFKVIEKYWQKYWKKYMIFKTVINKKKQKLYVLDMFPYPSGEGLHVGHLLGYIASDIYTRYKRHEGYNVLHPMGFDSFGLPAEQHAIQTGKHPKNTIIKNIIKYKKQLDNIGLSFDWSREIKTNDPNYYKWTQWIFIKLFNSWYDKDKNKARNISILIEIFSNNGNYNIKEKTDIIFSKKEWNQYNIHEKEKVLQKYRLAFKFESNVNWCPDLGTVLSNDEIKNGKSKRGGHSIFQKKIKQWHIRIKPYSDRLLMGLKNIDSNKSFKDSQKEWIGKKFGMCIYFKIFNEKNNKIISIFTTKPYTIFGTTFIALSTEHELINQLIKLDYKNKVNIYINNNKIFNNDKETKYSLDNISGVFTGLYCLHPFTNNKIPIYISNYVLSHFGTGAIMGVPSHNNKDYILSKKLEIKTLKILKTCNINHKKTDILINSFFLNGLNIENANKIIIEKIKKNEYGIEAYKYKIKNIVFSRQRYWGEPIPIYYKKGIPYNIPEKCLPLLLPNTKDFLPTKNIYTTPLSNNKYWAWDEKNEKVVSKNMIDEVSIFPIEINTMPGLAGSSWYFLRYMDPNNNKYFISSESENYWKNVDLYIGGSEHYNGHILYARFIYMFLKDNNLVSMKEPFKKIINQGIILSNSSLIYRDIDNGKIISYGNHKGKNIQEIHIDINLIKNDNEVDIEKLKNWRPDFKNISIMLDNTKLLCKRHIEKMSKSKFNIINPDKICYKYGADTLRLYQMFLGPINKSKYWDEKGIIGVHNFLKKLLGLFYLNNNFFVTNVLPSNFEMKILHKTIKKVRNDIEKFSYNTAISSFMIFVNNLKKLKCQKRKILEPLVILLSPFVPHICEHIWKKLGYKKSICFENMPEYNNNYLIEDSVEYIVMFNGKFRFKVYFDANINKNEINKKILTYKETIKFLNGKSVKNIIVVLNKMINILI